MRRTSILAVALGAATLAAAAGAPTLLGEGLAGGIPAQRTARHEALGNPAGSTLAGGFRRGTTPVRTPALEGKPRPAQPPASGTASPDNGAAGSRGGPAQPRPRMAPDINGVTEMPAPVASAPSAPAAVTGLGRRGWVLIAIAVLLLVLAGTVALVLAVGTNRPPSAATAAGPAPAASPVDGPEAAIPALGATIPVGRTPNFVAIPPNGRHAYVANGKAQIVTVVDTAINQVTATIPIPTGPPQFLALAPDGRTLYVSIFNDQRTIHAIDVLDTASNTVVATIPQPARPYLPAVSRDGKRIYVPNHDTASVSVIGTDTNTVIAEVKVAPNPHWVTFSRDGTRAYTANHESNVVSVIDTTTLGVLATVPVGASPHSIAVHPSLPLVANVNYDGGTMSVIDTVANKVVATIPVGRNPQDIAWAPDGRFAYVVNEGSNSITVVNARTDQVTATIPTGGHPTTIATGIPCPRPWCLRQCS